jgi:hypothetical protein
MEKKNQSQLRPKIHIFLVGLKSYSIGLILFFLQFSRSLKFNNRAGPHENRTLCGHHPATSAERTATCRVVHDHTMSNDLNMRIRQMQRPVDSSLGFF